jgi:hypothetical protein
MEAREGNLYFGRELDIPFRLFIRIDVQGHRHLTLLRDDKVVTGMQTASLALLQFFLENPQEPLKQTTILDAVHLSDFDNALSNLRHGLDLDQHADPRFIETLKHLNSYRFMLSVTRDGDLGTEVFPRWRWPIFDSLLSKVSRGTDAEDLRIVTVAFASGVQELQLDRLLKRNSRIRIVMMEPRDADLLRARHGIRQDGVTVDMARLDIVRQIKELSVLAKRVRNDKACTGSLEVALSRAIPAAFIAHSPRLAVAGIFLATTSHSHGPMMEFARDTDPWQQLYEDWKARWESSPKLDMFGDIDAQLRQPLPEFPFTDRQP